MELVTDLTTLRALEASVRDHLGDRVLLAARRRKAPFPRSEYVVICSSTKLVTSLGGRECSVHTAIFRSVADGYLLVAGEYGLTLEDAWVDFSTRYAEVKV